MPQFIPITKSKSNNQNRPKYFENPITFTEIDLNFNPRLVSNPNVRNEKRKIIVSNGLNSRQINVNVADPQNVGNDFVVQEDAQSNWGRCDELSQILFLKKNSKKSVFVWREMIHYKKFRIHLISLYLLSNQVLSHIYFLFFL